MTNRLKSVLLIVALTLLMAVSAFAQNYVTVTGTNVRLRLQPSLQSETLTTAGGVNVHPAKGEKLECLGQSGKFYQVKYKGKIVYIAKQFAQPVDPAKLAAKPAVKPAAKGQQYVVVTGTNVRLRKAPSLQGAIYTVNGKTVYPAKGERIKLMGEEGGFYKVNYQGSYLYISKDFARPE